MNSHNVLNRIATAIVSAGLMAAAFPQAAHATATDIADVPMAVKNTVHPNIMYTLDDSGSMHWDVAPDHYTGTGTGVTGAFFVFPRPNVLYGTDYSDSYGTITSADQYFNGVVRFVSTNQHARYFRTARFNPLYYDPAIRYLPWANADGSLWASASPTAAPYNPANSGEGTLNLTVDNTADYPWLNDDGTETKESVTYYPATYYKFTCADPTTVSSPTDSDNIASCFTNVEVKAANAPFTKAAGRTDCAGSTCTYGEEIQNFANWFSYYRSRILAARAGTGRAFARMGTSFRVGFGAINKDSTTVDNVSTKTIIRGVRKFESTARTDFFSELYNHVMPAAGTPLRRAMDDVGQYFSRTDDRGPWGETPGSTGGTQYSCRANYHILMTDGYWNGDEASTSGARNNNDGTDGPTIAAPTSYTYTAAQPYTDGYSNTLADVAMYYWKNDLRTDLDNRVPTSPKDPAYWQHMVNFTVGFGVTGSISATTIAAALSSPSTTTITWPNPSPSTANAAKSDDLAHAAVNSRGGFFSAGDPTTFADALTSALQDVVTRTGAAAAVAVSNPYISGGDNYSYASSYNSGTWTGDLQRYSIDTTTGAVSTTPGWTNSSATQLNTLCTGASCASSTVRKIASYSGSAGVAFSTTGFTSLTSLNSKLDSLSATDWANVLNFLRGDRSMEGTSYRTRASVLGDIVNAEPVVVGAPRFNYADTDYATYRSANASRARLIYQGGNDGMLHTFDASNGAELWAYVPGLLFSMPLVTEGVTYSDRSSLVNLSLRTGFSHQYYVDGTPVSGDVDFKITDGATGSGTDWRTILVGGLRKGGRGYYALDASSAATPSSESDVVSKVLWEFPSGSTTTADRQKVGYSFGRPIITKTTAKGWVALVASGYNNGSDTGGDGQGYLFVLNARTGELIKAISTGVGSASDPSGLAYISGFVSNGDIDNTVKYVYGGDLKGNVWRFNLTGNNINQWDVVKLATLKDASNNLQPITLEPEVGIQDNQPLVLVGTGRYLGDSDVSTTSTQSMYALLDNLATSPEISPLRGTSGLLEEITVSTSGTTRTLSGNTVNFSTKRGWFIDLPTSGERVFTDPQLARGVLFFTSNIPSAADPCVPGGSSWLYAVNFATGKMVQSASWGGTYLGATLASRPTIVQLPDGRLIALVRKSDATTTAVPAPPGGGGGGVSRVSWREVIY